MIELITLLTGHGLELAGMLALYILLKADITKLEIKMAKLTTEFRDLIVGKIKQPSQGEK